MRKYLSTCAKLDDNMCIGGMSRKEKHIQLTEIERLTIQEGSKFHPKPEFRIKCQGLLLNHTGMKLKAIATHLGLNHNSQSLENCWNCRSLS